MNPSDYVARLQALGVPARAAERLTSAYAPNLSGLADAMPAEIAAAAGARGVPAWARRIPAAWALVRTIARAERAYRFEARDPDAVASYVRAECKSDRETFVALYLDSRARLVATKVIAIGTLSQVDVHPREVFRDAVRWGAHSIVIAHNHPSGDPDPSSADVDLTERVCSVGRLVGIPVLDHVVVTQARQVSLAAVGLLPSGS